MCLHYLFSEYIVNQLIELRGAYRNAKKRDTGKKRIKCKRKWPRLQDFGRRKREKGTVNFSLGCVSNCVLMCQFESLWLERPNRGRQTRTQDKWKWQTWREGVVEGYRAGFWNLYSLFDIFNHDGQESKMTTQTNLFRKLTWCQIQAHIFVFEGITAEKCNTSKMSTKWELISVEPRIGHGELQCLTLECLDKQCFCQDQTSALCVSSAKPLLAPMTASSNGPLFPKTWAFPPSLSLIDRAWTSRQ